MLIEKISEMFVKLDLPRYPTPHHIIIQFKQKIIDYYENNKTLFRPEKDFTFVSVLRMDIN